MIKHSNNHKQLIIKQITTIDWKNYTDNNLKISFEYPANWTLTKKENRFEDGPDICIVNGPDNMFKVSFLSLGDENSIKKYFMYY